MSEYPGDPIEHLAKIIPFRSRNQLTENTTAGRMHILGQRQQNDLLCFMGWGSIQLNKDIHISLERIRDIRDLHLTPLDGGLIVKPAENCAEVSFFILSPEDGAQDMTEFIVKNVARSIPGARATRCMVGECYPDTNDVKDETLADWVPEN